MNKDVSSTAKAASRVGTGFLRILGSGEIVKGKNFSEITQLYEVEAADGKLFTVQSNRVSKLVTPEEAAEFVRMAQLR